VKVPLLGFMPDVDPTTPGAIVDGDAFVPTVNGVSAANNLNETTIADLADVPTGTYATLLLDGTKRMFASTGSAIYEASGATWTDRSRSGGYSGAQRQRFCTFGNNVLATNRTEVIGQSSPGGAFADISGAPKASIIVSVNGFVMAFDTNDGTYGDRPDGWWCSGLRDQTLWTPSLTTQSANGRLLDSPGRITAGAALGTDVVAYKASSMYLGRYVGPPLIWLWQQVPGEIGCAGAESVVVVDSRHFFVGQNDFFMFDGTTPKPLNAPCREWFFTNLDEANRSKIIGAVDIPRSLIYWHYPSKDSSGGALDSILIYNYRTNQWGKQALSVAVPVLYSSGATTYDDLGTSYATYDDLPAISYDSPFWSADETMPAVFVGTKLYALSGTPRRSWILSGDFGDATTYGFLKRVTPRYRSIPEIVPVATLDENANVIYVDSPVSEAVTATNYYRDTLGSERTEDATCHLYRHRFDFRRAAHWHSIRLDHQGPITLDGLDVDIAGGSNE
jgi:hypothetical protein